ncbi:peptidoglycan-binding protein [Microcoleus sp.]|uniref:peptidoglycan-binding protein n=1 Tax=Microcoleus sp. TaxID=44472 RepID=UPI00403EE33A
MSSTTQMKSTQAIGKKPQLQLGSQGKVDGDFSTLTEKAVRAFQKSFRIEADGIVNQETWTALSQIPRGYDPKWFLT